MATVLRGLPRSADNERRFFLWAAVAMSLTVVAGFSLQFAAGRSTFRSPLLVHAHAIVFMGWVALNLLQNVLAASGSLALHRRLGWIGAVWIAPMIVLGCAVTVAIVRRGQVPFFFQPVHFLVFDPLTVIVFAGLTLAAIVHRRQTDWHSRLHFCAMSLLLGPAFGRLLPMPLLAPWAYETTFAATLLYPAIGLAADLRRRGAVHRAWWWGIGTMVAAFAMMEAITYSPAGLALYDAVTAGSPGAAVAPRGFPPPPTGPLITGRTASI